MSNELTIVGNVGETIELHNLPGGGTVCNFSVADNRVRQLEDGSYKTISTTWRPAPRPAVPTQYPPHGYQAQPTNGYQQHPAPQAQTAQPAAPRSPQGYQQAPAYPAPYTTDQPPF